ncbi:hypothetical protein LUZ61_009499 [Rhynchospora tenuis]|uniref:CCHC-type domain-containing protein n=1 Tax=Rhynchospora tenuis TaxID=198213 RepID=A0AAD5ZXN7_9POAL|nr:hypothetical protein LUZ61_009499 [Rhynchospora tenuis]
MSGTQTKVETEPPRPSVTGMGPNTTNPTIQDQIRGYRLGARLRYEAQRRLPGRSRSYNRTLESQLSPDAELNISQYRRAQQVQAETLYRAGWSENQHRVYQHYSDERVLVPEGQQIELPFITEGSFQTLLQEGLQHLHIGMIMVRLYTLHRKNAGVNALVLLRDTRWGDSRAVISSMEMDLSSGTQLAYTAPDITLSIHDFRDHIQIVIQTHGYEGWQGGESNLLLSRSLIGRLSNTSHTNFRYNVQNVADHLASRGVRAIPGTPRTTEELQERQWIIRPAIISRVQIPQDVNIHSRTDGSLSIRFANYSAATPPNDDIQRGTADEEELEQESINLLTPEEYWPWDLDEGYWDNMPEFPDPSEHSDADSAEQDEDYILGSCFVEILGAEKTEPTVEMLEPMYPYVWIDEFDDKDPIIQFISEEISWAELVDNEQYWHQDEQALMMTCQWDESDEDESDELEHFLNVLHSPTEPDLLSLLVGQGGKDCGLPQIPQVSDKSEIRWDPEPSESVYALEDMEYPLLKQLVQKESVFSTAESSLTRIPPEPIMGPAMYPPASSSRQPTGLQVPEIRARLNNIRGGYANQMNERYNLPSARANQGAILVLPEDIGLYEDVFSRWESITLNLINERNWADNRAKVNYIENLLGEIEKKMWIQWRMIYNVEYEELINIADDPQNVLSQIRRMFLMEDPATGSTDEQNRAYQDLERLSYNYVKDIFNYINDYKILAAKSGRMYVSEELSVKFFRKMPPILGNEIEKAFAEKYPGNTIGVMPRIKFTYDFLAEQCKKAALQRSLKDLSFCSQIPVPGYYQKNKRYGLRKSKTYRGKPHDTHIRVFKKKHSDKVRKCKCFICGEEEHFARECKKQQGNIARAAIVDNLDLDDDWDVLSVDLNEPDSDAICSFSEGEGSNGTTFTASIENLPYESAFMLNTTSSWRYIVPLPEEMKNCVHEWEDNSPIPAEHIRCKICKDVTNQKMRAHCVRCFLTVCPMCSRFQLGRQLIIQKSTLQYDSKDALIRELVEYTNFLLTENQRLKERILELELSTEMKELPRTDKGKGLNIPEDYDEELDYDIPQSSKGITIKMMNDEYISTQVPDPQRGKRVLNRLYNIKIQMEIPGCEKFTVQAILDTGATICCADEGAIPEAALEPSAAMQGGLRIEGQMVTFYKNITTIATKVEAEIASPASISELDLTELEFQEIQRAVAYPCGVESTKFKEKFYSLLNRLREQGYIGEEPMKYWSKNQVVCKLDIINPDITIQDKPLKHVTPAMNEQFNKHIQALLKIGVIRPSKSRHRTMAMMVNSGTSIDPKTGQEVKGGDGSRVSRMAAFVVPGGLYEWLVMPFGLKNAPAIFQRKMDNCFRETEDFIAVYIDDILVFSENEDQHAKHLKAMLSICEKWGLVLSPTKMKVAVPEIEFLGAVIDLELPPKDSYIILETDGCMKGWGGVCTGVKVNFEHIDGKLNVLADSLSRLTAKMVSTVNCCTIEGYLEELERVLKGLENMSQKAQEQFVEVINNLGKLF